MRPSNMRVGVYVINNFNTKIRMKVQYIESVKIKEKKDMQYIS